MPTQGSGASVAPVSRPFRWDVRRREQLGRLVGDALDPPGYTPELRRCCARILAMTGDAELVFVGRSPESLFDYLSGITQGTSWEERVRLVNVSLRFKDISALTPEQLEGFRDNARGGGLAPAQIYARPRPTALVDVVASGDTLGDLVGLLSEWAEAEGIDVKAMRAKLRFVGMTPRRHTSPNTWRWWQHSEWAASFPPSAIKNVTLPYGLFGYLANDQPKVARTHPPRLWADNLLAKPTHTPAQRQALAVARALYEVGLTRAERLELSRLLGEEPAVREPWCRGLISELRGRAASR